MAATKSGWHLDMIEMLNLVQAISERAPFIYTRSSLGQVEDFLKNSFSTLAWMVEKNVEVLITASITDLMLFL